MFPNEFTSFGSTASTISDFDALTGFPGSSVAAAGFSVLGLFRLSNLAISKFAPASRAAECLAHVYKLAIIRAFNP
jgi:hypothetical protein